VLLAGLNGLRLLAPVTLLGDLASALDVALAAKVAGTLLDAPREEALRAAKASLRPLVPLVRRGLIEGVYGFDICDAPPSEALQEMLEKIGSESWVDSADAKEPPTEH
jgi:hypothetical protein